MNTSDRIEAGLTLIAQGLVDSRARVERGRAAVAAELAALVTAEQRFRALANGCARARQGRHLRPGEIEGPRRQLRDGPPRDLEIPVEPPARDRVQESLAIYGLMPSAERPRVLDEQTIWRGIIRPA